jgi:hypothetical protein
MATWLKQEELDWDAPMVSTVRTRWMYSLECTQEIRFPSGTGTELVDPVHRAITELKKFGVSFPKWGELSFEELGVLVTEAVNLAAKYLDEGFYGIKPELVDYVAGLPGVESGWGYDGVFYLYTPATGACCFHDPYQQITAEGHWPHPWSGIRRQDQAFRLLTNTKKRAQIARRTRPGV